MKTIVKITSALLIFAAPIVLVLIRYQTTEATEAAETAGIGIIPTIIIIGIGAVAYGFISQQFLEMVRTDKFGFLSIAFFGILLGILSFSALFIVQSVKTLAQTNYERFIGILEFHQETLLYVLLLVATGVGEILLYKTTQIKIKRP
jgi:hypothetical protein